MPPPEDAEDAALPASLDDERALPRRLEFRQLWRRPVLKAVQLEPQQHRHLQCVGGLTAAASTASTASMQPLLYVHLPWMP